MASNDQWLTDGVIYTSQIAGRARCVEVCHNHWHIVAITDCTRLVQVATVRMNDSNSCSYASCEVWLPVKVGGSHSHSSWPMIHKHFLTHTHIPWYVDLLQQESRNRARQVILIPECNILIAVFYVFLSRARLKSWALWGFKPLVKTLQYVQLVWGQIIQLCFRWFTFFNHCVTPCVFVDKPDVVAVLFCLWAPWAEYRTTSLYFNTFPQWVRYMHNTPVWLT